MTHSKAKIRSQINFNHLYYFHVIAEEGTLVKASKALQVSQPTLSEQLKSLEEYLGVKLFTRKSGGLQLNRSGQKAHRFTKLMFRASERLVHSLNPQLATSKISLQIGVASTIAKLIAVNKLVDLFRDKKVLVEVKHGDYQYLLEDLLSGELEILLADQKPSNTNSIGIGSEQLYRPSLSVVCSKTMAKRIKQFPKDLIGLPFIKYSAHSSYRNDVVKFFETNAIVVDPIAITDDIELMLQAAASNLCFAIVPTSLLERNGFLKKLTVLGKLEPAGTKVFALFQKHDPSDYIIAAISRLKESD